MKLFLYELLSSYYIQSLCKHMSFRIRIGCFRFKPSFKYRQKTRCHYHSNESNVKSEPATTIFDSYSVNRWIAPATKSTFTIIVSTIAAKSGLVYAIIEFLRTSIEQFTTSNLKIFLNRISSLFIL